MAKKLLIETRMNSLSLKESKSTKELHPGCLGTIEGPCADFVNPTRNDNYYSRKLWVNVFNDDIVKESLQDRILIGELDHPGDRLDTKATNAAIVMTDYSFDDNNGVVNGTFDILDTPNGRILKSLLDYGCKIGVSSRGEGDVEVVEGINRVDEDGFNFIAFDAVVLPAVKAAKPTLREGLDREEVDAKVLSLKESLSKEVNDAQTIGELTLIKKVVEATNLPDADSLLESVKNKSQELKEGTTSSSNTLLEDLEKSNDQITKLKEESKSLKESFATCKTRLASASKTQIKLNEEVGRLKHSIKTLESKYSNTAFQVAIERKSSDKLNESLKASQDEAQRLKDELRTTCSENKDLTSRVSSLEESLSKSQRQSQEYATKTKELSSAKSNLVEKYNKLVKVANTSKTKIKSLKEEYTKLLKTYAVVKSESQGVNSSEVLESLTSKSTTKDVDTLVESIRDRVDRYRNVPASDSLFFESVAHAGSIKIDTPTNKDSSVESDSLAFLESASKYI